MGDDGALFGLGFFIGLGLGFCLLLAVEWTTNTAWQKEAVEHNAAYYHPETGEFTWKVSDDK